MLATFDSYRRNMHNHVIAHIGATRLTRVDGGVLNSLYAKLLLSGRRPSSRKGAGHSDELARRAKALRDEEGYTLSGTAEQLAREFPQAEGLTKDAVAGLLRRPSVATPATAVKDAVRRGRLARNPADAADPPRVDQNAGGAHAWDAAALRAFLDRSRAEKDRLYPLWVLLATTGMRRGEALGLRWNDVDLTTGRIPVRVVQTVIQIGGRVSIGELKTLRGRRSVKLDTATVATVRAHPHRMNQERLVVGPD